MSNYTPKPGQFSLFKNDRKEQPNHPDYRGDGMTTDGQPAWISAWLKESNGKKFFSISIKPKEERQERGSADSDFRSSGSGRVSGDDRFGSAADLDDEIPFISSLSVW